METISSYVMDGWVAGGGSERTLVNPATEEPVATLRGGEVPVAAALDHARSVGGPALRAMTFAERGEMLRSLSESIVAHRTELLELSMLNNGATRSDAKFDVDGASFTLSAYAGLGAELGDRRWLVDGEAEELLRSPRFAGLHVQVPRRGVALHVNAYNFPAWGLAEKAAVALLAGMPVVTKPATATALTAWRLMGCMEASGALPSGALSFIAGRPAGLVESLQTGDVLAFTGSGGVGCGLKADDALARAGVPVNVEADSLNAAVLGPDVSPGDDAFDLFVADVFRDMTQKTGQKCTAIRRVIVPEPLVSDVIEAIEDQVSRLKVGSPHAEGVRMGPLVSASQRDDVVSGLARLDGVVSRVLGHGGRPEELHGVPDGKGFFVGPHLFKAADYEAAMAADIVHDEEVFGPSATVLPYDGSVAQAAALVARGRGSLVTSIYSDDRQWTRDAALEIAPWVGRVAIGSKKVAGSWPGPGTVLPQLVHGGPGRAGGGEELGGPRGLSFYMQRAAIQGYRPLLERVFDGR